MTTQLPRPLETKFSAATCLVVRVSDFRPEGLGSMPVQPNTLLVHTQLSCERCEALIAAEALDQAQMALDVRHPCPQASSASTIRPFSQNNCPSLS
ncbi:hypothetical protein TNCV_926511 [Trichonephila clavipes]|nr:hypothetical protein TNCV_926511 [Trichonephila clavipes]